MRTRQSLHRSLCRLIAVFALLSPAVVSAQDQAGPYNISKDAYIVRYNDVFAPVISQGGMVSTQNDIATRIGAQVLADGGNAIDASVAVGFALNVTLPRAGNIGGGGFMVVHDASADRNYTIDYRETAPSGVTAQDFLDEAGEKDADSRFGWAAIGVPGTVAGLHKAWEMGGSMEWSALLQPSIDLAVEGFVVSYDLAELLAAKQSWLGANAATATEFYKADGTPYQPGEIMRRPVLGKTLTLIAEQGPDVFYRGEIAEKIAADMEKFGGHIDLDDLRDYEAIVREPVTGQYRGYEIVAMAPPSSGGIAIVETLNILERFPLNEWGFSAQSLHVLAEAMKLTFADRGNYLADPAFFDVPVEPLTNKDYAATRSALIKPDGVISSASLEGGGYRRLNHPFTKYRRGSSDRHWL